MSENFYPGNVYQFRETLVDKLDSFGVKYASEKKTLQKFRIIRLWIDLCQREDLQRHKYNKLDGYTGADNQIHFFNSGGRTTFLILITSLHLLLELLKV